MENQRLVAIIPARSGSKRVPHKNIIPFYGHPLIAYTIKAALNSQLFEKVIVSTDDDEIGHIAEWYGAEYLPRPIELATDDANLVDVSLHALETLNARGSHFDLLCQLMPNCPLRRSEDIIDHYDSFRDSKRDFQISVVDYRGVYPHWAISSENHGEGRWIFGLEYLAPSQTLGKVYCPTGAIWWVRVKSLIEQRSFYGSPFHILPIDSNRGMDIDRSDEVELSKTLVEGLWKQNGICPLESITQKSYGN